MSQHFSFIVFRAKMFSVLLPHRSPPLPHLTTPARSRKRHRKRREKREKAGEKKGKSKEMEGVSYDIGEVWATKKDPVRRRCGTRSFVIYSFGTIKKFALMRIKGMCGGYLTLRFYYTAISGKSNRNNICYF